MAINSESNDDLAQLMHKAQEGDKAAYSQLLHTIIPIIKGFIYNRIGRGDDHDDILQEILLGIHRASHTYNTERPFKNWMFAIANYKVKDYLRAHYRHNSHKEVDFANIEDFIESPVTYDDSPSEILNEALSILPEKQRDIVYKMKIEGYSAKEVAEIMGMSTANVKVIAHRAYKILLEHSKKQANQE